MIFDTDTQSERLTKVAKDLESFLKCFVPNLARQYGVSPEQLANKVKDFDLSPSQPQRVCTRGVITQPTVLQGRVKIFETT